MTQEDSNASFWDHLDILRKVLFRIIAVWAVVSVVAFVCKDALFGIVFAPKDDGFATYRLIDSLCRQFGLPVPDPINIQLINTGLAQQFMTHMKTALCTGVVVAAPYALYELFGFIAPGLYNNERLFASRFIVSGYFMFLIGICMSYFIIFPMTFQFLGAYQVSDEVVNMISLESYMSTLIMMCLCMGIVCELPVMAWLAGRMGLVKSSYMTRYRRHAVVVILIVAAVITPTSDVFTLMIVSLPIWLLYEFSVLIVRGVERNREPEEDADTALPEVG